MLVLLKNQLSNKNDTDEILLFDSVSESETLIGISELKTRLESLNPKSVKARFNKFTMLVDLMKNNLWYIESYDSNNEYKLEMPGDEENKSTMAKSMMKTLINSFIDGEVWCLTID